MSVPVGEFIGLARFIELVKAAGCEERTAKFSIVTPWGVRPVRYLLNPVTGKAFDISDLAEGEGVAPSTVNAACRRLGISIDTRVG
jgi:hypothetical protein